MCGITGFWSSVGPSFDPDDVLSDMISVLRHRGPDAEGRWSDAGNGIHLGHTRLSVIDVSTEGNQPMVSASGRYVITYNGEIFNYRELRRELEPASWRGHSDTEVMLAAFERWGVEEATGRFNGQFAFAVWDSQRAVLTLVRDRLGIKPLYYSQPSGTLIFGSELKTLQCHPALKPAIDTRAVGLFLELGYIPGSHSILEGVYKLPTGCMLELRKSSDHTHPRTYWSLKDVVADRRIDTGSEEVLGEGFERLLRDSVRRRMIADVPVGAFLSGGIDSSLVVALMQKEATASVKTFSVGFNEDEYDEAPHATRIAEHLGTDHTNLYVQPKEIVDLLIELPTIYDEPFADESQVPTAMISRLARGSVTVCLSGDGGDELFGGYSRYDRTADHWRRLQRIPAPLRRLVGVAATPMAAFERTSQGRRLAAAAARIVDASVALGQVSRHARLVGTTGELEYYVRSVRLDTGSLAGPRLERTPKDELVERLGIAGGDALSMREIMMLADGLMYLPDDILVKVDRASMNVALEVRVPFLDHRVVEASWRIPQAFKLKDGQTKWMLRRILGRYVPPELFERPKQGFAVPLERWLRGPLRDWAESLVDPELIARDGLLNPSAVRALWHDHLEGRSNSNWMIWRILTLQAWLEGSRSRATSTSAAGALA